MTKYKLALALKIISGRKREMDKYDYETLEWLDWMGPEYIGPVHDSVIEEAEKILLRVLSTIDLEDLI